MNTEAVQNYLKTSANDISPLPVHFEVASARSGDPDGLVPSGYVPVTETVSYFLENEYTGKYEENAPGGEREYLTFGDEISIAAEEIVFGIMYSTICDMLQAHFHEPLSADNEDAILRSDDILDNIRISSGVNEFSMWNYAVDCLGIGDITLADVLRFFDEPVHVKFMKIAGGETTTA